MFCIYFPRSTATGKFKSNPISYIHFYGKCLWAEIMHILDQQETGAAITMNWAPCWLSNTWTWRQEQPWSDEKPSRWISEAYLQLTFSTPEDRSAATFLSFRFVRVISIKNFFHILVSLWLERWPCKGISREADERTQQVKTLAEQVWQLSRTPGTVWRWEEQSTSWHASAHTQWWSRQTV